MKNGAPELPQIGIATVPRSLHPGNENANRRVPYYFPLRTLWADNGRSELCTLPAAKGRFPDKHGTGRQCAKKAGYSINSIVSTQKRTNWETSTAASAKRKPKSTANKTQQPPTFGVRPTACPPAVPPALSTIFPFPWQVAGPPRQRPAHRAQPSAALALTPAVLAGLRASWTSPANNRRHLRSIRGASRWYHRQASGRGQKPPDTSTRDREGCTGFRIICFISISTFLV